MWIHYPDRVEESEDLLLNQERRLRCSPVADRVKMLRLLKSGRYRRQAQLPLCWATAIGRYADGGSATNTTACPVYWRIQAMVADPSASHRPPEKP